MTDLSKLEAIEKTKEYWRGLVRFIRETKKKDLWQLNGVVVRNLYQLSKGINTYCYLCDAYDYIRCHSEAGELCPLPKNCVTIPSYRAFIYHNHKTKKSLLEAAIACRDYLETCQWR